MDTTGMTRDDLFQEFWLVYPRRVGKKAAGWAWGLIPVEDLPAVIEGLQRAIHSDDWRNRVRQHPDGSTIPYPEKWLLAERWTDEYQITIPKQPQRPAIIDRCDVQGCEAYSTVTLGCKKRCSAHVFSN